MQMLVMASIFDLVTPGGLRACKDCNRDSSSSTADMIVLETLQSIRCQYAVVLTDCLMQLRLSRVE